MKRLMSILAVFLILPQTMAFAGQKEVYHSEYGVKYHYSVECSGKYPKKITLTEARELGLKPCKKCVN